MIYAHRYGTWTSCTELLKPSKSFSKMALQAFVAPCATLLWMVLIRWGLYFLQATTSKKAMPLKRWY